MIAGVIVFTVILVVFSLLFLLSRSKYGDYIEPLDKKEYKLRSFIPVGLFILDIIKYKYTSKYDRRLQSKVAELKGMKYSMYYLQIHHANKIVLMILILLLFSLLSAATQDVATVVFGILVVAAIPFFMDRELTEKVNRRRLSIQIDFPDFLNKLILLVNAGMTVSRAWEKSVTDNDKDTVLYQELRVVLADIRGGKSETSAFEDFANRCRIPEITKFVSVLLQNFNKGNAEMISILRLQATECWEMRKHAAKRLGEEASSKMLFPMMLMFIAVILIVATPAILTLTGGM
ncbi:MAG TPA: type II secretion system F family protein [Acetivibrio sp.]|uniref:type II secretion system F family protein n=1 Tax=Acetivibrio sp. TaxID=1872092 RepID=UPI002B82F219|nr:type II secretion system F family protein [Acetivibrio sp.]HOM03330.1 type II secretion system F family protein [Acetivibrio sp.]